MAITLEQLRIGKADKVDMAVVDMFRRHSLLLDKMIFDNVICPGTGGSTLTYGYLQLANATQAARRHLGEEYVTQDAQKLPMTAQAVPMGGAFTVDRVAQSTSGCMDEVAFQTEEKVKATANCFHNLIINGQESRDGFSGLDELLADTDSDLYSSVSIANTEEMDQNYNAFLDEMDSFLAKVDGKPDLLLMNREMLTKLRAVARRAGYYERSTDGFGNVVETYAGIPMVDMGKAYDEDSCFENVIPVHGNGTTDIYAVCLGLDAFHGISPTGDGVINTYLPDMNTPGAVKRGEVELVAGVVLKNRNKAARLSGVKIC